MYYSNNGRFLIKTENVLDQQELFEDYDKRWGKPKKVTSIGGKVTKSKYDGFGRLIETEVEMKIPATTPITTRKSTITYAWESAPACYSVKTVSPDQPTVTEYFDILERSIKKEITGFKNSIIQTTTTYNAKGLVETTTAPHKSSINPNKIVTTTKTYDGLNQVISVSVSGIGATNITYAPNKANGELSVTTTTPIGKESTQITDASGKVIKVIDDGGFLKMSYKSHGGQYKVVNDTGQILMETKDFDAAGRATNTKELNSGDSYFTYNAFGELISQKIASAPSATTFVYTKLGQIKERIGPEGTTTNTYYPSNSGLKTNAIKQTIGFKSDTHDYTYDDEGRLETYTESILKPGTSQPKVFITKYSYYESGKVKTKEYPDGLKLRYNYNKNGYLVNINDTTNLNNVFMVYKAKETDDWGHLSDYTLGNNITTQKTFDGYGYPRKIQAGTIQNMEFNFNINSGNLDSRKDNNYNLSESFTYDGDGLKLDRLSRIDGPNGQVMSMLYEKNGNIKFKTGLQDYTYHSTKIHAVTRVENYPTDLNRGRQDVEYTPFHSASKITEKFNIAGQKWTEQIEIAYGADYERNYTKFVGNTQHTEYEIYYTGDYEELNISGVVKKIHYIYGGDGLCAMVVDEGAGPEIFSVYKDYLGSILTVVNSSGSKKYEQSFDAWGRRRGANDWKYYDWKNNTPISPYTIPKWLYRGYTGHEHYDRLSEIVLINMNARLYDPVNGRMLRWDIALGVAGTQGFNRYSYANNNPLKYSDPTGNFIDPVTGFAVGNGLVNVIGNWKNISNAQGGFWGKVGTGLGYFGVGVASGYAIATGNVALGGAIQGYGNAVISIASGNMPSDVSPLKYALTETAKGAAFAWAGDQVGTALGPLFEKVSTWTQKVYWSGRAYYTTIDGIKYLTTPNLVVRGSYKTATKVAGLAVREGGKAAAGALRYESELTKNKFIEYSTRIASKENYFDVAAHGTPNVIEIGKGQYNHRVLATLLEKNPDYVTGQPIRLLSCNTGVGSDCFAKNLANKLGVEVYAPNNTLWAWPNGRIGVGPEYTELTGEFVSFFPFGK